MKHHSSRKADSKKAVQKNTPASPFAGRPLDGSQYIDVVEEQEYADRRATPEEERPRFSYLHDVKTTKN
ncbi:hypothetical protein [Noviherbaspirillum sp. ST9]|uniref:hypothetical protein n=1 Tax=Noviherbaspirillum sp. ST9 TaxID=3401606 RepID=UPI003B58698B